MTPAPTGLRTIALAAFFCMFFGTCGVGSSLRTLTSPLPDAAGALPASTSANAEIQSAAEAFANAMLHVQSNMPARRLIEAANLLVSALLIVTAFNLMRRAPSSVWWTTQAAIANGLHTAVRGTVGGLHLYGNAPWLGRAFDKLAAAERAATPANVPEGAELHGIDVMHVTAAAMLFFSLVEVSFYVALALRIRRRDVADALIEPEQFER